MLIKMINRCNRGYIFICSMLLIGAVRELPGSRFRFLGRNRLRVVLLQLVEEWFALFFFCRGSLFARARNECKILTLAMEGVNKSTDGKDLHWPLA